MYSYIIGKVVEKTGSYIVVENNGIGYTVYTPNPYVLAVYNHLLNQILLSIYSFLILTFFLIWFLFLSYRDNRGACQILYQNHDTLRPRPHSS